MVEEKNIIFWRKRALYTDRIKWYNIHFPCVNYGWGAAALVLSQRGNCREKSGLARGTANPADWPPCTAFGPYITRPSVWLFFFFLLSLSTLRCQRHTDSLTIELQNQTFAPWWMRNGPRRRELWSHPLGSEWRRGSIKTPRCSAPRRQRRPPTKSCGGLNLVRSGRGGRVVW